jgi:hypothetical protein
MIGINNYKHYKSSGFEPKITKLENLSAFFCKKTTFN